MASTDLPPLTPLERIALELGRVDDAIELYRRANGDEAAARLREQLTAPGDDSVTAAGRSVRRSRRSFNERRPTMTTTTTIDLATVFEEATEAFAAAHDARVRAADLLGLIEHALDGSQGSDDLVVPELPVAFAIPIAMEARDIREGLLGRGGEWELEALRSEFGDLATLVEAGLARASATVGERDAA